MLTVPFYPEPLTCPSGGQLYEYDQRSANHESLTISQDDSLTNVTNLVLRPSTSGLTSDTSTTLRLKLTPTARKSNIYVSLEVINAESVDITSDNDMLSLPEVSCRHACLSGLKQLVNQTT